MSKSIETDVAHGVSCTAFQKLLGEMSELVSVVRWPVCTGELFYAAAVNDRYLKAASNLLGWHGLSEELPLIQIGVDSKGHVHVPPPQWTLRFHAIAYGTDGDAVRVAARKLLELPNPALFVTME